MNWTIHFWPILGIFLDWFIDSNHSLKMRPKHIPRQKSCGSTIVWYCFQLILPKKERGKTIKPIYLKINSFWNHLKHYLIHFIFGVVCVLNAILRKWTIWIVESNPKKFQNRMLIIKSIYYSWIGLVLFHWTVVQPWSLLFLHKSPQWIQENSYTLLVTIRYYWNLLLGMHRDEDLP